MSIKVEYYSQPQCTSSLEVKFDYQITSRIIVNFDCKNDDSINYDSIHVKKKSKTKSPCLIEITMKLLSSFTLSLILDLD